MRVLEEKRMICLKPNSVSKNRPFLQKLAKNPPNIHFTVSASPFFNNSFNNVSHLLMVNGFSISYRGWFLKFSHFFAKMADFLKMHNILKVAWTTWFWLFRPPGWHLCKCSPVGTDSCTHPFHPSVNFCCIWCGSQKTDSRSKIFNYQMTESIHFTD